MKELLAQACKTLRLAHVLEAVDVIPLESKEQFLLGILQAEIQLRKTDSSAF